MNVEAMIRQGVESKRAQQLLEALGKIDSSLKMQERWQKVSRTLLKPADPIEVHRALFDEIYQAWDSQKMGPKPVWAPQAGDVQATNLQQIMDKRGFGSYAELFDWAANQREEYWRFILDRLNIQFREREATLVDLTGGVSQPEWLPDAKLNIVDSCFQWPEDHTAIIFQEPGKPIRKVSYGELDRMSNRVANSLVEAGFKKGDSIAIDMLMNVEAVAIYLGIVKAGMAVIGIADSFAAEEIAVRLRIGNCKAVFTQDFILRGDRPLAMYQKLVDAKAAKCIVLKSGAKSPIELRQGDQFWQDFLVEKDLFETIACNPDDPMNILFSSGTTGDPKAIPWTHTTPIKCAADAFFHHDVHQGDVLAWPTSLGWMMGPWLIYAGFLNHATIALYAGIPTGSDFCKFVEEAEVDMLGVVPSLVKAWRNTAAIDAADWSHIKLFSSTGECSNADDYFWLMSQAGYKPVVEYCGGTEIGGGYITGTLVQPQAPATFSTPALGLDLVLIDEKGKVADEGEAFIVPPSMGLSTHLLNRDHHEVYFDQTPQGPSGEVLRRHGDQIKRLAGGYYQALGRADDTMNLGGIKISSAEIERTLNRLDGVLETAAIAVAPEGGGPSQLVVYVVQNPNAKLVKESLKADMQKAIKQYRNPLFKVHDVCLIDKLPRTASNKVMRRVLRSSYREH